MTHLINRYPFAVSLAALIALAVVVQARADDSRPAAAPGRHVIVVVMDGLRPDSVTPELMPSLAELAKHGTTFNHHHAVFVSSTEVNGTAIVTGGHPDSTGIIANREYRPAINGRAAIAIESERDIRMGDDLTHGHYLSMPTVAELLRAEHRSTAVVGSKPVALLLDRSTERCEGDQSVTVFEGKALGTPIGQTMPAFPVKADAKTAANLAQDQWTTDRLVAMITQNSAPVFSVLWLSEPDFAQHGTGPGSSIAKAALKNSDDCLAHVLKALEDAGVRQSTDVLVVSDHGFSTISRTVETAALLRAAGFSAAEEFKETPRPGDVLVVGNGGAVSLYVIGHDASIVQRLVDFLEASDFAGTIFTKNELPGTFELTKAHIASGDAPDILFSLQWTDGVSKNGVPGLLVSEGVKRGPGQGTHASLSPFDMHNTLIASGPDFREGFVSEVPSGNTDVAPTVMTLLGFASAAGKMDGRVLSEAFRNNSDPAPIAKTQVIASEPREVSGRRWQQWLQVTKVGKATYYDQGSAESKPIQR